MHHYFQHVILFLKRFLWLLILYTLSRIFFYVLNAGYFSDIPFLQLLKSFVVGIRFDIAAISFTNILFVLLLLPGNYKNNSALQKTGSVLFFIINAVALMGNFVDAKFFDFINKRSTSSIFSLMGANRDVWLMIPQFLKDYWYVAFSWILLMVIFWRWMPRLPVHEPEHEKITVKTLTFQIMVFAGIIGILFWGARGTALKPIGINDAANYAQLKFVPLVLNTPFSIIKTLENENLAEHHFFPEDALKEHYDPIHHDTSSVGAKRMNVVVIILESFSKEYSGYLSGRAGYTPHLDSVLKQSLVFSNAYANGTQSYEALPAIIAGIPSLMERPYSGSNYSDNYIESMPRLLGESGYHTSFFHGGNNGTMGFDNFARIAGISQYHGRNEYNNDTDYDGHWGVWDEPFLQYFAGQLENFPQPFFTSVFTLSSHHPFNVPEQYKNQFPEERLPILKSIRYADYSLGEFFDTASRMPWFKNTLFVLTADHAAQAMEKTYNSTSGMYAIPIAFYCPSDSLLKGINTSVAQQIDIMPTVLSYLGFPHPFFAFGENLLNPESGHWAISYINGIYQLIQGDYILLFNGEQVTSFYNKAMAPEQIDNVAESAIYLEMETRIKAILQTFSFCLINNRMYYQNKDMVQSPFEIK
jgi:phosphoglycerol transferase MdoB-like AlkP superfamily enzyme